MISDLREGFYLKELLVEPRKGIVTGKLRSVHLAPKAMDVLLHLAARPGEVVHRDELIAGAWPNGGSSEALSHAVSEIRHILDDHADHPRYIQTLPGEGYRLMIQPSDAPASKALQAEPGWFGKLKHRGVLETALAYVVLGWLILQVVDVLFDQLHFPDWAGTFITVGVIAGFPIALVLSWFLEFRHGRATLHDDSGAGPERHRFSSTYVSVVGALAIAAIMVFFYDRNYGLPQGEDPPPPPANHQVPALPPVQENAMAVLPFLNLDGSEETEIFAQGLVDDVLGRLARVPGLLVSARGDAFTLAPNTPSARVRERLRVARYIEGSVQMKGDRLRVIVQLIDSETGFHEFSRTFDKTREDFFEIRDEITALTVANVRVALPADMQAAAIISSADPSLDAYVRYRQGVEASRQPISDETISLALSRFDEALVIDPGYAAAHAGKCTVYVGAYPIKDDSQFISLAEQSCSSALSLNPNLDVVHAALGQLYRGTGRYDEAENAYLQALAIYPGSSVSLTGLGHIYRLQKKTDLAEKSFRQAIGLHPGDWSSYNELGRFLYRQGRYAEAAEQYQYVVALDTGNITGYTNLGTAYMMAGDFQSAAQAFEQAIEIKPWSLAFSNLGLMHYYMGKLDPAVEAHQNAVRLAPNDHLAWSNLGDALLISGEDSQAVMAFETAHDLAESALEVNPNDAGFLMDKAWIEAMLGDLAAARQQIDRAKSLAPNDPYVHYIDGLIRVRAGETESAVNAFERAANNGYSIMMLSADPQLEALRNEPGFARIVENGKLP